MKRLSASVIVAVLLCASTLSIAAKPDWAGNGQGKKHQETPNGVGDPGTGPAVVATGSYFQEQQRAAVMDYYGKQRASGHCPPGLAKKNNGCQPPGQAKQWARGKPLGGTVLQYPLPPDVLRRLGSPPAGHKFVRVANDILLIAVGTSMVIDAIEDLMR